MKAARLSNCWSMFDNVSAVCAERKRNDMSAPQVTQTEQMMSDQIRKVYEQTKQGLNSMTDPHTALMFIDTQIRTLRYMLPLTTQLWNFPALAQQISNLLAYLDQIRPDFQALAQRTPPPQGMPKTMPAPSGDEWLRITQDIFHKYQQLWDSMTRNYLNTSVVSPPSVQAVSAQSSPSWGCTAVCPQTIGYTYCGKQCILSAGHYGPHQCPDGHQWL